MRLAIAWLVVAGCGRIAFDPLGDGGTTGAATDANDAQQAACVDFDVILDLPQGPSVGNPGLVWTGSEYWVVIRTSTFALQQIGADGTAGGHYDVVPVTEPLTGIAWSGSSIALVTYISGSAVRFRTFDPTDHTVSSPVQVNTSTPGSVTRIEWAGDRYIVGWNNNVNVAAREVSATGQPLSPELLLSTTGGQVTTIAVTPSTYVFGIDRAPSMGAVVTYQRQSMTIQTLPVDTGSNAGVVVVPGSDGRFASVFNSWNGGVPPLVQLHDSAGTPVGSGVPSPLTSVTSSIFTSLQPTSTGYRMYGVEAIDPHEVSRAELDVNGNVTLAKTSLGQIQTSSWGGPSVIATAGRSLVVFPYDSGFNPTHMRAIQTCSN